MAKQNCWELSQCGRQTGGNRAGEFGVCPAVLDASLNGLNAGTNGGRMCWVVSGTFCDGEIQGTAARKALTCRFCDVYRAIRDEEGSDFFGSIPGRGARDRR